VIIAAVMLAGAFGALVRYLIATIVRPGFPAAVLIVNVVGSFAAGAAMGLPGDLHLIAVTGFCGGLTTFSTLSVETVQLVLGGQAQRAALSIGGNLVLGIAAAALGYALFQIA
jgi:fluoride exporter